MTKFIKTFRIDRKKWLRGKLDFYNNNVLWCDKRQAGCCLGHVIHQTMKCSWDDLKGGGSPEDFYKKPSLLTQYNESSNYIYLENNSLAQSAMLINDDVMCSDEDREKDLKDLFNSHGYNLEFYN